MPTDVYFYVNFSQFYDRNRRHNKQTFFAWMRFHFWNDKTLYVKLGFFHPQCEPGFTQLLQINF